MRNSVDMKARLSNIDKRLEVKREMILSAPMYSINRGE